MRRILLLVSAVIITACGDSPTAPALDRTAVMTASVVEERGVYYDTNLLFGSKAVDTASNFLEQDLLLGQQPLGNGYSASRTAVLDGTDRANVLFHTRSAWGLESDGKKPITLKVLSDWKALAPEKNRAVAYNGGSDFYFMVMEFELTASGAIDFGKPMRPSIHSRRATSENSAVELTLPAVKSMRFIFVAQHRSVGCSGNGSLTMRSEVGLVQIYTDIRYDGYVGRPESIQDVTLECILYEGARPESSLSPSTSLQPATVLRDRRIEKVGHGYVMTLN